MEGKKKKLNTVLRVKINSGSQMHKQSMKAKTMCVVSKLSFLVTLCVPPAFFRPCVRMFLEQFRPDGVYVVYVV